MLSKLKLLGLFHEIIPVALEQGFPATQYYMDNGTRAFYGLTCKGYHLWLEYASKDEGVFLTAPVPLKNIKQGRYLLEGKGTLPFDEFKMSTITARKLQYYFDLADESAYPFKDPPMGIHWNDHVVLWRGGNGSLCLQDSHQIYLPKVWVPPLFGEVFSFKIPNGEVLIRGEYGFVNLTEVTKIPAAMLIRRKDGLRGTIAAWNFYPEKEADMTVEFKDREYHYHRQGGRFTCTGDNKMDFKNVPRVEDLERLKELNAQKRSTPAEVKIAEPPPETSVPPVAPTENTNPAVPPQVEEKPAITPESVGMPEVKELPISEQLELGIKDAEMLKLVSGEVLRKFKALLKSVAKLERSAGDSAELKELRSRVKELESENARLRNTVKEWAKTL